MKAFLCLSYLAASVIAEFTNPNWINGKRFWSKGEEITIRWDDYWPNWGDGPVGDESLLDLWITGYANDAFVRKLFGTLLSGRSILPTLETNRYSQ